MPSYLRTWVDVVPQYSRARRASSSSPAASSAALAVLFGVTRRILDHRRPAAPGPRRPRPAGSFFVPPGLGQAGQDAGVLEGGGVAGRRRAGGDVAQEPAH